MTYLTAATRAAVERELMNYLTLEDLEDLHFLATVRLDELKGSSAGGFESVERVELVATRERLLMEIKNYGNGNGVQD